VSAEPSVNPGTVHIPNAWCDGGQSCPGANQLLICARCGRHFHGQLSDDDTDLYPDLAWCPRCDRWVMVLKP
jgi:DNA-directed RNA polymerase subunit RPC12/RpoP